MKEQLKSILSAMRLRPVYTVVTVIILAAVIYYAPARVLRMAQEIRSPELTGIHVLAIDRSGRAIYYSERDGRIHGHFERGFLGFGWKIVPEDRGLTEKELVKVTAHEAKYAARRAKRARRAADKAEEKMVRRKAKPKSQSS